MIVEEIHSLDGFKVNGTVWKSKVSQNFLDKCDELSDTETTTLYGVIIKKIGQNCIGFDGRYYNDALDAVPDFINLVVSLSST